MKDISYWLSIINMWTWRTSENKDPGNHKVTEGTNQPVLSLFAKKEHLCVLMHNAGILKGISFPCVTFSLEVHCEVT